MAKSVQKKPLMEDMFSGIPPLNAAKNDAAKEPAKDTVKKSAPMPVEEKPEEKTAAPANAVAPDVTPATSAVHSPDGSMIGTVTLVKQPSAERNIAKSFKISKEANRKLKAASKAFGMSESKLVTELIQQVFAEY